MITLPNLVTLLRFPLALAFLQQNVTIRVIALILAGISDSVDGLIARKLKKTSRIGTFLDPLADKFFVITVLTVFLSEEKLTLWEAATMLCRDFSVMLFGTYLAFRGRLLQYQFRAILFGKITTAIQLSVLLALTLQMHVPPFVYGSFVVLGILALVELYVDRYTTYPVDE